MMVTDTPDLSRKLDFAVLTHLAERAHNTANTLCPTGPYSPVVCVID